MNTAPMKMLPYAPEDSLSMENRFDAAVADPLDADTLLLGTTLPPAERRSHTFDRADGLRLVVARIRWGCDRELLTVAASVVDGSSLDTAMMAERLDLAWFRQSALETFRWISCQPWPLQEVWGTDQSCRWQCLWTDSLLSSRSAMSKEPA